MRPSYYMKQLQYNTHGTSRKHGACEILLCIWKTNIAYSTRRYKCKLGKFPQQQIKHSLESRNQPRSIEPRTQQVTVVGATHFLDELAEEPAIGRLVNLRHNQLQDEAILHPRFLGFLFLVSTCGTRNGQKS